MENTYDRGIVIVIFLLFDNKDEDAYEGSSIPIPVRDGGFIVTTNELNSTIEWEAELNNELEHPLLKAKLDSSSSSSGKPNSNDEYQSSAQPNNSDTMND